MEADAEGSKDWLACVAQRFTEKNPQNKEIEKRLRCVNQGEGLGFK